MNSAICGGSLHNDSEQDYAIYLFYATQGVFRKAHTQENLSHLLLRMEPCPLPNKKELITIGTS